MIPEHIERVFIQSQYRCFTMEDDRTVVYYKYYQEGFHVVLARDAEHGNPITAEEHRFTENRVFDLFYHPIGRLPGFPEGYPVSHVEALTLFIGSNPEQLRELCSIIPNAWACLEPEGRLFIYEEQPGDFWGLRSQMESIASAHSEQNDRKKNLWENIKDIRYFPYITIGIVAANLLIFIFLEIIGDTTDAGFIESWGGLYPEDILYNGQWWRLITSCFLHFGAAHLMNNMVIFYCVGSRLERAAGHIRFFVIYMLSGLGGSLLSYYMMLGSGDYAVAAGASGAVFGTIGGLLWAVILHRGKFEGMTTRGLLVMLALSLYYGFSTMGVDNWGHIGGMITGFLVSIILCHRKRQRY